MISFFLVIPAALTLAQAESNTRQHLPQILSAHAGTLAAQAVERQARAPLLPQVNGAATYRRTTGNFAPSAGSVPSGVGNGGVVQAHNTLDTFNSWSFGVAVQQLLYDFGETLDRWRAARTSAEAQREAEANVVQQSLVAVRTAFFIARATKALVAVSREAVDNQQHRLDQTVGFVNAGRYPEINLATARTNLAAARVLLVTAENNYAVARAQLNLAMGVEQSTDYDVADDTFPAVAGEDGDAEALVDEAKKTRPDVRAIVLAVRAQTLALRSAWEQYAPALSTGMNLNAAGVDLTNMAYNWTANITLSVPIFNGLGTQAQVDQQKALLAQSEASLEQSRQQVRVDVVSARLAVRAAKENLSAGGEALTNAREQLRLAQGRYGAGVGSIIELNDAQLAVTTAAAQVVQAEYNLSTARSLLVKALGRA
jgi:outer membrane protein